jgi:hypothetical protein
MSGKVAVEKCFPSGVEVINIVTTSAVADGSIGYALQSVETSHGEVRVLLAMRRDIDGR